jgi:DNA-binding Lrp family transcriptional regulator
MDEIDRDLVSRLRRNARASYSELAGAMGLSRTTVRARLDRLVADGVIQGFTVVLRDEVQRAPVRGLMMLGIEGRWADRIAHRLNGLESVEAVHSTNGKWDLIVEIGTETLEAFDRTLSEIRRFDGVVASETNLLLSTRRAGARSSTLRS